MPVRPLLSRQQELDLIEKAQNGNSEAENSLLWHNEGFITLVVKQLTCGLLRINEIDDYLQEGRMGFLEAIRDFDPRKKCKLTTYAYWKIKKHVTRYNENNGRTIRIPSHILQKVSSVFRKARNKNIEVDPRDFKRILRRTRKKFDVNIILSLYWGCTTFEYDSQAVHHDPKHYDYRRLQECVEKESGVKKRNLTILYKYFGAFGYPEMTGDELSKEYEIGPSGVHTVIRESMARISSLFRQKRIKLEDLVD